MVTSVQGLRPSQHHPDRGTDHLRLRHLECNRRSDGGGIPCQP